MAEKKKKRQQKKRARERRRRSRRFAKARKENSITAFEAFSDCETVKVSNGVHRARFVFVSQASSKEQTTTAVQRGRNLFVF